MAGLDTTAVHTAVSRELAAAFQGCVPRTFACTAVLTAMVFQRSILRILPALAVVWADTACTGRTLGFCTADTAGTANISVGNTCSYCEHPHYQIVANTLDTQYSQQ